MYSDSDHGHMDLTWGVCARRHQPEFSLFYSREGFPYPNERHVQRMKYFKNVNYHDREDPPTETA